MSGKSPHRASVDPVRVVPSDRFSLWVVLTPFVALLSAVLTGPLLNLLGFLAIFLTIFVIVGWSFSVVVWRQGEGTLLRVITLLLTVTGMYSVGDGAGELALWLSAGEVTPAEVPAHTSARVFSLREATTQPGFVGRYAVHRKDAKGHDMGTGIYEVVPLVGTDWTPASPVPAWAVYPDQGETFAPQPHFALRSRIVFTGEYERARQDAMARHGLQQVPGAPILEIGESPRALVLARCHDTLVATAVLGVPWLVVAIVSWRRRPRSPVAPS